MSYLVFARKFRPQSFLSVAGQEHITLALANAIVRNKVAHAYLFSGPRGVGKTSTARVFAKALNCTGRDIPAGLDALPPDEARSKIEPCGECTNCQEIAASSSMAVWEIDGASNNSVDNVRDLIDSLKTMPPPGSRYKIYIIDEVHMLSTAAFNALLKSLEEPPPATIFIFATTELHKIPETVISRCQRYDFRRVASAVITETLQHIADKEGLDVAPEVMSFIAMRAQGGMRDAQSMFDRLTGFAHGRVDMEAARRVFCLVDAEFFIELSQQILARDAMAAMAQLQTAFQQSLEMRSFLEDFLRHWRNMLLVKLALESGNTASASDWLMLTGSELESIKEQVRNVPLSEIQRMFELAEKSVRQALGSQFPRYVIEALVVKMASSMPLLSVREALEKLGTVSLPMAATGSLAANIRIPAESSSAQKKTQFSPLTVEKKDNITGDDTDPEPARFDPSWEAFVEVVRKDNKLVLASCLRRVIPGRFELGELQIKAAPFDRSVLMEPAEMAALKNALFRYSGFEQWKIEVQEDIANWEPQKKSAEIPTGESLVERDAREAQKRTARIEKEAREGQLVKEALKTFSGSVIEKVIVTS